MFTLNTVFYCEDLLDMMM